MAAKVAREQPPWVQPKPLSPSIKIPDIKIYNSLTRRKDTFVPNDPEGKTVTWYTCGPTVYDDAHLGHAKNFVSTDVLRRIMKDYFAFDVKFVMNTTDIDDKIILRGRQQHLLQRFKGENDKYTVTDSILETANSAYNFYVKKNLPALPSESTPKTYTVHVAKAYGAAGETLDPKLKVHLRTVQSAAEALASPPQDLAAFYEKTDDLLLPYLDSLYGSTTDSGDHSIFLGLTQKYEKRFFEDMHSLNVLDPDVLVRVTEHVPQIVTFVQKIVDNGFAYATSDGSVYFDIDSFEKAGHEYARLEPWSRGDQALQADGEGSLTSNTTSKRGDNHFALWKASKAGEPSWPSPWGPGRPGWHIECSVMASEVLGRSIDLHSGGVDLRFPHHDNELAQSEGYWTDDSSKRVQWINYFLHCGHLSIQGQKMSKSLKNFTTVRAALAQSDFTARSLRICFLLGTWQDGFEMTQDLLKNTVAWEGKLNNFFLKSLDVKRNPSNTPETVDPANQQLLDALEKAKTDLDTALRDSFYTPGAMRVISDLITEFNSSKDVHDQTVLSIARWITRIVTIFGLDKEGNLEDTERIGWSGLEIPSSATPFVYDASQLRDKIRSQARSGALDYPAITQLANEVDSASSEPSNPYEQTLQQFRTDVKSLATREAPAKELLSLCDQLRDTHLWNLGVYLEDRDNASAMVRPLDRSLIEARADRESAIAAKLQAKLEKEAKENDKAAALREKAKQSHLEMFRTDEFSEWDDQGIPTKDKAGEEVAKSRRKKLTKEWERQKKIHEEYLASQ